MKKIAILLLVCSISVFAADKSKKPVKEGNVIAEQIKKAMELEKKYAREQRFYTGDEYDLKGKEVDPKILKDVPKIEPEYDFNMDTGVYDD